MKTAALAKLSALKAELLQCPGFASDEGARSLYVVALTVEGAVMFDDLPELAGVCVEFCKRKERDVIERG